MAVAGTTYMIQVSSFDHGFEGPFRMTITDPNEKPKPAAPGGGGASTPAAAIPEALQVPKRTVQDEIARCRKAFPGKGKKARTKRAACITKAKLRFALAKCRESQNKAKRRQCAVAAHRRFAVVPKHKR
jgi:hypothetical protein